MNGNSFAGIVVAVLPIIIGVVFFGVLEEVHDGSIENAVESVNKAIK